MEDAGAVLKCFMGAGKQIGRSFRKMTLRPTMKKPGKGYVGNRKRALKPFKVHEQSAATSLTPLPAKQRPGFLTTLVSRGLFLRPFNH